METRGGAATPYARNLSRNMRIEPRSARHFQRPHGPLLGALIVLGVGLSWAIAANPAAHKSKAVEVSAANTPPAGKHAPTVPAKPALQLSPEIAAWAEALRKRFGDTDEQALRQIRIDAQAALAQLRTSTDRLPDGAVWAKTWDLVSLEKLLVNTKPTKSAVLRAEQALSVVAPAALEPNRRLLVHRLGTFADAALWSPADAVEVNDHIYTLAKTAEFRRSNNISSNLETAAREAFAALSARRRGAELLAAYRAQNSTFNFRNRVGAEYVGTQSKRHFQLPVDFRSSTGGISVHVHGTAVADATVQVVPNSERAEVRVDVQAVGKFTVDGAKGRMRLQAASTQRLKATQPLYIDAGKIDSPGVRIFDRSCTRLNWLCVCLRLPLVERIAAAVASRIAAKKLAEHDSQISRQVEKRVRERVEDEAYDITYRINGGFGKLASSYFPADGEAKRLIVQSDSDAIHWRAMYVDDDELGALAPPRFEPPSVDLDVQTWLHESAINNWGSRLSGRVLDEATYWTVLREEFKLQSSVVEKLPPLRSASVIRFSNVNPLTIRFEQGEVAITLGLQGYMLDNVSNGNAPRKATARYRLQPNAGGMQFQRTSADFADDATWKSVLDRFLPPTFEPKPRFQNSSFKDRLTVRSLSLADGWLFVGTVRTSKLPSVSAVAKE